jgi:hypothetical protein
MNSHTSCSHSSLPRYPYPGKSIMVNFFVGTVYPFSVLVCPGLLDTLAKLWGAAGNNEFRRDDFCNDQVGSIRDVRRRLSGLGRRLQETRHVGIERIFRR